MWKDLKGEMLVYDESSKCSNLLLTRDLYVNDCVDGTKHLCEMYSLNACEDYGPIKPGDVILIIYKPYAGLHIIPKEKILCTNTP